MPSPLHLYRAYFLCCGDLAISGGPNEDDPGSGQGRDFRAQEAEQRCPILVLMFSEWLADRCAG